MGNFEFVFSLFGLLLGLSLAEVIAGFGRAVEAKVRQTKPALGGVEGQSSTSEAMEPKIGLLTPLLGLFVTFNLVSFWTAAWALRDQIPVLYLPLLFGLFVTGGYYFAAAMVFPRTIDVHTDLDGHYFEVKRWVVAVVTACNLLVPLAMMLMGINPLAFTGAAALNLAFYALLVALFFAHGKLMNLLLLGVAAAVYPVSAIATAVFI